jgi:hypothetical protein
VIDSDILLDDDDPGEDCQACISPIGTFRISWDVLSMLLVIFVTIMVPLRMAFDVAQGQSVDDPWFFVDTFIDVFFLIDLFLNFFTGTESTVNQGAVYAMMPGKGRTEMRLRVVAINYITGYFWLDLAASLPINLILIVFAEDVNAGGTASASRDDVGDYRAIKILRTFKFFKLVRLLRLLRLSRAVTRLQDFIYIRPGTKQLIKLMMMLALAIHYVSCVWFLLGSSVSDGGWVHKAYGGHNSSRTVLDYTVGQQYVTSVAAASLPFFSLCLP